jgi:predicted nucleic acid-binding protein
LIVLDSSAWLELISNGNPAFVGAVKDDPEVLVPTVCLYEVSKRLLRDRSSDEVAELMFPILEDAVIEPLDADLAARAAGLSLTTGLAMADAIIYATAVRRFATLWTQDPHFEGLSGVQYVPRIG